MENKSHAFMAGLFAILLGFAALGALYWLGGKKEAMAQYVVVTKQNVGGLNPQSAVRYRGIGVGKVTSIELDEEDVHNILITIQVRENTPVNRGTVAKLAYQGITGLAHVLLEQGPDETPFDHTDYSSGPRIPMANSLFDELGEAGPQLVKQTKELMASLNDLLNDQNRQKFSNLLNNLNNTSAQMTPAVENLNQTLTQARKLLNDENVQSFSLAAKESGPLLAETRALVARLQTATDKLDTAIGDSSAGGAAALMPRINELASDISATSRQLNRVLKILEDSPQSLVFGAPATPPGPGEAGFTPPPAAK